MDAYLRDAVMEPIMTAADALQALAAKGRISPAWPAPAELERARHELGIAAVSLSPQLAKQIGDRGEEFSYNQLELPRVMTNINQLLARYRGGAYATSYQAPEAQAAFDALREVHAKIQPPAIVRHVIDPARRELGQ